MIDAIKTILSITCAASVFYAAFSIFPKKRALLKRYGNVGNAQLIKMAKEGNEEIKVLYRKSKLTLIVAATSGFLAAFINSFHGNQ